MKAFDFLSRFLTGDTRAERRDAAPVEPILPFFTDMHVGTHQAENLSTVLACVNAISGSIAALDTYVYRRDPAGRTEAPSHPAARLLRRPNDRQTGPDWMEWTLASVLLHGNAVSVIEWDGAGRPASLTPIPWPCVGITRLPSGRLRYDVMTWDGKPRSYFPEDIFHLRDRSDDGVIGRSRISRAREVLAGARALQDYSLSMWRNQAVPSGVITLLDSKSRPDPATMAAVKAEFKSRMSGPRNAREVMFLGGGMQWQGMSLSPEDAEALDSRKYSVAELCRIYGVPPPIVQDYSNNTFTNAAQASLWFAQNTLMPWVRKIEAEFARSIFGQGSPFELVIDMSSLMRGDYASRWQSYGIAVQNSILTVDEIREQEGYNPRKEGADATV
ncbi:phage portal protein [Gluconacetobacter sp. 1b LMG 1731]|uniref:Phage portal protein n=1 Tax=Gluconacetobacter dulcium TaxID=2729096 RepID=A0A7W4IJ44_9PROT|nr:phage portal protein [Gluconacetobacter dulcium]MBB2163848.1 phage portal protein [Gluconacetobacter dulcium]MBB2193174.1 phage portal protein [Gluconacetobacter dulcium]